VHSVIAEYCYDYRIHAAFKNAALCTK
jgi:hypothetical protein